MVVAPAKRAAQVAFLVTAGAADGALMKFL
jgi:hypothetical protein